jgi:2-polyprenyl-6-methoxyphenol hydroxylase-like FAD-dependent oxidoreductase
MRLEAIEQRVGAPSLGIHRADLLRLLAGAVDQGSIHVHTHCVGFSSEQEHVIARFADGHEQQTDLLVGADGLYSVIREQLLGKAPPRYSGYTRFSWRRRLRGSARLPRHFQRDVGARSALRDAADRQRAGVLVCHARASRRRTRPRGGTEEEPLAPLNSGKGRVRPWKTLLSWPGASPSSASQRPPCAPMRHPAGSAAPPSSSSPPWSAGLGSGSNHCSAGYVMGSLRSSSRRCFPDCLSQT